MGLPGPTRVSNSLSEGSKLVLELIILSALFAAAKRFPGRSGAAAALSGG